VAATKSKTYYVLDGTVQTLAWKAKHSRILSASHIWLCGRFHPR